MPPFKKNKKDAKSKSKRDAKKTSTGGSNTKIMRHWGEVDFAALKRTQKLKEFEESGGVVSKKMIKDKDRSGGKDGRGVGGSRLVRKRSKVERNERRAAEREDAVAVAVAVAVDNESVGGGNSSSDEEEEEEKVDVTSSKDALNSLMSRIGGSDNGSGSGSSKKGGELESRSRGYMKEAVEYDVESDLGMFDDGRDGEEMEESGDDEDDGDEEDDESSSSDDDEDKNEGESDDDDDDDDDDDVDDDVEEITWHSDSGDDDYELDEDGNLKYELEGDEENDDDLEDPDEEEDGEGEEEAPKVKVRGSNSNYTAPLTVNSKQIKNTHGGKPLPFALDKEGRVCRDDAFVRFLYPTPTAANAGTGGGSGGKYGKISFPSSVYEHNNNSNNNNTVTFTDDKDDDNEERDKNDNLDNFIIHASSPNANSLVGCVLNEANSSSSSSLPPPSSKKAKTKTKTLPSSASSIPSYLPQQLPSSFSFSSSSSSPTSQITALTSTLLNTYTSLLHSSCSHDDGSYDAIRRVCADHVIVHCLKGRVERCGNDLVKGLLSEKDTHTRPGAKEEDTNTNSTKISKKVNKKINTPAATSSKLNQAIQAIQTITDDDDDDRFRDQGFTRAKVLVLMPTKGTAFRFVRDMISSLIGDDDDDSDDDSDDDDEGKVDDDEIANYSKFRSEYGPPILDKTSPDSDYTSKENSSDRLKCKEKGPEWNNYFNADIANIEDDFKLGISLPNPRTHVKKSKKYGESKLKMRLYSDFYTSDIIVCSPLGMNLQTQEIGNSHYDADFLSSVEVVVVGNCDLVYMQNIEQLKIVLEKVNVRPVKVREDMDFSRVRKYFLGLDDADKDDNACTDDEGSGGSKKHRQTIILSSIHNPEITSIYANATRACHTGSVKIRREVKVEECAVSKVEVKVRQVFQVVRGVERPEDAIGSIVSYFSKTLLPKILTQNYNLIFIPSYYTFVKVRNHLLSLCPPPLPPNFVSITEYSRPNEITRGRSRFYHGQIPMLLVTGRHHFYNRLKIRGGRNVFFLGVPDFPSAYSETVNSVEFAPPPPPPASNASKHRWAKKVEAQGELPEPSVVTVFTGFEGFELERVVGSGNGKHILKKGGEKSTFLFA